ncbi:MAG: Dinoroseobacter phage vB DshS-R5C [Pseudomonadota bacterium]|jgi:DNA polymerase I-like protein with 3'-5' exonuclease and polymerase domains
MTGKLQMAMFPPKTDWVPPIELPDITGAHEIAIDVETRDPNLKNKGPGWPTCDGEVVGYAIAVDGWAGYIPVGHLGGGNLDRRIVGKWLKRVFECPADKIMHNAQYDLGWIQAMGFTVNGRIIDTMMTAGLIDENRFSYSLNALCYDYLGKTKSEKTLVEAARDFGVDPKGEMYKLPAMYVGPYAETDAVITLELWHHLKTILNREDLWTVWNLEMSLLPYLVQMTMRGIRVDLDRAERTKQTVIKREKETLKKIKSLAGDVEIWAAQSIAKAFDAQKLDYPKTEKGAPSFTKAFLSSHPHELPRLIVQARNLNKISGSFIDGILKFVHKGRVHSHINQLKSDDGGTVSGRMSYNSPNLQQIPARDPELGPMIRSLFLPEEGQQWAAIDYSQQEPRTLVHFAKVYGDYTGSPMGGVDEFVDEYRNNPKADFHTMVAEMAGIPRKQAKGINLGMIYGMGKNKLATELDLSLDEASALLKTYNDRVPFVKGMTRAVMNRLDDPRSSGHIRSLLGRRCRFDLWEPDSFEMNKAMPREEALQKYGVHTRLKRAYTYKALNRLIQASAADITKKAMVDVCEAGHMPMLQVHDELAFSVESLEQAKMLSEVMAAAVPMEVPMRCDIEIGPSWGECEEID